MSDDLEYKGYRGSVEYSGEDRVFFGKVLFVDSLLMYHGTSVDEIEQAFKKTVDHYLALCKKTGRSPNKPYSGSFNVRIGSDLHRKAVQAAYHRNINLNEYVTIAIQFAVDQNGVSKVEHIHQHNVTITTPPISETRFAGVNVPLQWETFNETIQ